VTRRVWLVVLLLVAAGGAGIWWWSTRRAQPIMWQGYAEADFVKVGPTQSGLLTAVKVARGDAVAKGALLFTQDDVADRAARDQAREQLAQAQNQLANLQAAMKPTEIAQAQANLTDAKATLARTASDLARGEAQLPSGGVSKQAVDQMRAERLSAQAKVDGLQAALTQAQAPMGRETEIQAQKASVAAFQSALDMAEWRLTQRFASAPTGGRIADVLARPGETMMAGDPVVSLLPPENIFVRFFVPEPLLGSLHRGDPVGLKCDSCANGLTATISYIAPQAEYTPPLIYSEDNTAKLVFLIEARPPPDQATRLNPGQPVEVHPLPAHAP
jgi:HlyD family secretion protein